RIEQRVLPFADLPLDLARLAAIAAGDEPGDQLLDIGGVEDREVGLGTNVPALGAQDAIAERVERADGEPVVALPALAVVRAVAGRGRSRRGGAEAVHLCRAGELRGVR